MQKTNVPYKKSAKYTNKKSISLTPDIGEMWETLSKQYKVEVVDAVRPFVETEVRRLYETVVERKSAS